MAYPMLNNYSREGRKQAVDVIFNDDFKIDVVLALTEKLIAGKIGIIDFENRLAELVDITLESLWEQHERRKQEG